jgi:hypothetical protein
MTTAAIATIAMSARPMTSHFFEGDLTGAPPVVAGEGRATPAGS